MNSLWAAITSVVQKPSFVDVHLCGKLSPPLANWITPGQVISH